LAAGVATEYEAKADGHYIEALIVDPTSVKKIEAGVLKGFSIGIKHPRVIRDAKAANGRIVGGQIVEISVVDRPANSNAKMTIAKAVDGDLVEVEQAFSERPTPANVASVLNKWNMDQERDERGRFGSGGGGGDREPIQAQMGGGITRDGNAKDLNNSLRNAKALAESIKERTESGVEQNLGAGARANAEAAVQHTLDAIDAHNRGDDNAAITSHYMAAQNAVAAYNAISGPGVQENAAAKALIINANNHWNSDPNREPNVPLKDATSKATDADLAKYSEDQERGADGRFGSGGGGGGSGNTGSGEGKGGDLGPKSAKEFRSTLVDAGSAVSPAYQAILNASPEERAAMPKDAVERAREVLNDINRNALMLQSDGNHEAALANLDSARQKMEELADQFEGAAMSNPILDDLSDQVHATADALRSYHETASNIVTGAVLNSKSADLAKYNADQERDDHGRFGSGGGSGDPDHDRSVAFSQALKTERINRNFMKETHPIVSSQISKERSGLRERVAKEQDPQKQEALNTAISHLADADAAVQAADNAATMANYGEAGRQFESVRESVNAADRVLRDAFGKQVGSGVYFRSSISDRVDRYTRAVGLATEAQNTRNSIKSIDPDLAKAIEGELTDKVNIMSNEHFVNKAVDLVAEIKKYDEAGFNTALSSLSDLVAVEAKEFSQGHDERGSIKELLKSLKHLIHWYRGEVEEGEVASPLLALLGEDATDHLIPETHSAEILMAADGDKKPPFGKDKEEGDDKEAPAKDDAGSKEPDDAESDDKTDKEEMCAKCDKAAGECECDKADKSVIVTLDPAETETLIEKAVKSAREAVEVELELLKSAKAEADQRAVQLEAELADALNKSAAGGPVRAGAIKTQKHDANELLAKAEEYRAKAAGTEDRYLRDGYLELADDLETKARKS
jgi:hypothetical protein